MVIVNVRRYFVNNIDQYYWSYMGTFKLADCIDYHRYDQICSVSFGRERARDSSEDWRKKRENIRAKNRDWRRTTAEGKQQQRANDRERCARRRHVQRARTTSRQGRDHGRNPSAATVGSMTVVEATTTRSSTRPVGAAAAARAGATVGGGAQSDGRMRTWCVYSADERHPLPAVLGTPLIGNSLRPPPPQVHNNKTFAGKRCVRASPLICSSRTYVYT